MRCQQISESRNTEYIPNGTKLVDQSKVFFSPFCIAGVDTRELGFHDDWYQSCGGDSRSDSEGKDGA